MTPFHRFGSRRAGLARLTSILAAFLLSAALAAGARADANDDDRGFAAPRPGESGFTEAPPTAGPLDPAKAVIVVGLASTAYDAQVSEIKVKFGRYDPTSGGAAPNDAAPDEFIMERRTRSLLFQFGRLIDPTVPEFAVFQIPPGEWVLFELHSITGDPTNLQQNTTRLFPKSEPRRGYSAGPRFTVQAGEAIYVGTVHINALSFPNLLERITGEDEPAKTALLKKYPAVADRFAYRPMFFRKRS